MVTIVGTVVVGSVVGRVVGSVVGTVVGAVVGTVVGRVVGSVVGAVTGFRVRGGSVVAVVGSPSAATGTATARQSAHMVRRAMRTAQDFFKSIIVPVLVES